MSREKQTIQAMIEIYCGGHHQAEGLCTECRELVDYAARRLDHCPFGPDKPACAQCPIHCYKPGMRDRVQAVMRYAGPRMLYRHPVLAVLHQIDALKSPPKRPNPHVAPAPNEVPAADRDPNDPRG